MHAFFFRVRDTRCRVLDGSLLAIGASLRLWQYFGNPSLYIDELAFARNIVDRSLLSLLFTPLDFNQVAPKGFLLLEKLSVIPGGDSEFVLRLLPLLWALLSLFLFYFVAKCMLSGRAATLALALFAFSPGLISYGLAVKQYSSDVASSLLLIYLACRVRKDGPTWAPCMTLTGAGLIIVWVSQSAVFMLLGLGLALVLLYWKEGNRSAVRFLLLPGGILAGTSILLALLAGFHSMTPSTRAYMHRFWQAGFPPFPPHDLTELLWLWNVLDEFVRLDLRFYWPPLYVVLMALGGLFWLRRKNDLAWLLLAPLLLTLGAAIAAQYPFRGRLILFLVPCLLLAIAEGGVGLSELAASRFSWDPLPLAGLLVAPALAAFVLHPPVYRTEETRPMLAYIEQHHQPGDAMYVYYAAHQAFGFYGRQYRLQDVHATVGGCHRGDPRAYLRELDHLRGQPRIWIMFSHSLRLYQEQPTMLGYLDRIGNQREAILIPIRDQNPVPVFEVAAYLYDLSDSASAMGFSAETYPVPEITISPGLECAGGPQVPATSSQ